MTEKSNPTPENNAEVIEGALSEIVKAAIEQGLSSQDVINFLESQGVDGGGQLKEMVESKYAELKA